MSAHLRLVSRPIWKQLETESDSDFALFCWWVGAECPTLEGAMLHLAQRNDWTRRAQARATHDKTPSDVRAQLTRIRENILAIITIEVDKILRDAREEYGRLVSPTDMARLKDVMLTIALAEENAAASSVDLSDLPDSSFELVEKAVEIMRKSA